MDLSIAVLTTSMVVLVSGQKVLEEVLAMTECLENIVSLQVTQVMSTKQVCIASTQCYRLQVYFKESII